MVPFYESSLLDQTATQREIDFRIGWYLEPLTSGKYPDSMRTLVGARLPHFTSQESKDLKGSFDFLGFNYYFTEFTVNNPHPRLHHTDYILDAQANLSYEVNGVFIGSDEGVYDFRSYPAGLREVLNYTKHRYNNPPIYITETGYADFDNGTISLEQTLNDTQRVKYHSEHLSELLLAISDGSDVRGYFVWGLLDDFEWYSGYTYRFGLHYVDYKDNLKRYPRASAQWFKDILKPGNLSVQSVWEGEQLHHPL